MAEPKLADIRLLVVDDSLYMRQILRYMLYGFGVRQVIEAENGEQGYALFQARAPDIVVTDWIMPLVDGLELTRMIRNDDSGQNIFVPIILMSGHSERSQVIEARDAGITEFLCKPVSARSLYQHVVSCIANSRQFVKTKTFFGPDRRRFVFPDYDGEERRVVSAEDAIVDGDDRNVVVVDTTAKDADEETVPPAETAGDASA